MSPLRLHITDSPPGVRESRTDRISTSKTRSLSTFGCVGDKDLKEDTTTKASLWLSNHSEWQTIMFWQSTVIYCSHKDSTYHSKTKSLIWPRMLSRIQPNSPHNYNASAKSKSLHVVRDLAGPGIRMRSNYVKHQTRWLLYLLYAR